MKIERIFLFASLLLSVALSASAQDDRPYLAPQDRYTVHLARTSLLYPLTASETATVKEKASAGAYDTLYEGFSNRKHVRAPRGSDLMVFGYARSGRNFGYDTYVVSIGDELFFMSPEYVDDNCVLERKNDWMVDEYNTLSGNLDGKRAEWKRLALRKAPEVEAGLRRTSHDEARVDWLVDSLVAVRTAGVEDAFRKDSIRIATSEAVRQELRERRAAWTARKEYLVNPGEGNEKVADYFAEEIAVYKEMLKMKAELEVFERRNFLR